MWSKNRQRLGYLQNLGHTELNKETRDKSQKPDKQTEPLSKHSYIH